MLDKLKKIDWNIILPLLVLLVIGSLALHSATLATDNTESWFQKQIIWIIIGLVIMFVTFFVPMDIILKLAVPIYIFSIILLIIVEIAGESGMGATRWIRLGFFNFQPSEFAKISALILLAFYYNYEKRTPNKLSHFSIAAAIALVPFILILIEPDLGTSLVIMVMFLPILHWAGLRWITLFSILSPFFMLFASFYFLSFLLTMLIILLVLYLSKQKISLLILVFAVNIFVGLITPQLWSSLKPYQQNRIKVFVQPEIDPRGAGYQIIQSKVAIGSGGFYGKGWHKGTQVQLRFLPEQHTDFIMAVIGEEFGFFGATIVLLAFAYLLIRILYIASNVRNRAKQLLCAGIFIIFFFHILVNVGMTVGLMPVTGLPLPFISYGGSAMLLNFSLVGFVLNSWATRYN
ncbi:MAG: rod shape-determining protein RodA [Calditrichia bacterium]|nr:rod shape-determining protein RodA [Calditrichia bacterium]